MRFRSLTAFLSLATALLLSACDSSGNPAATGPDDTEVSGKANGTATLGGKTVPVIVAGIYDDTSMLVTIGTDIDGKADTGWSFFVNAEPGKGTIALAEDTQTLLGNSASHYPGATGESCMYQFASGSFRIDAWSETPIGQYFSAKMSGGATISLEASSGSTNCPAFTTQITFTDALATSLGK